jgi:hypothetical protein
VENSEVFFSLECCNTTTSDPIKEGRKEGMKKGRGGVGQYEGGYCPPGCGTGDIKQSIHSKFVFNSAM